jgi:hypothetical protein
MCLCHIYFVVSGSNCTYEKVSIYIEAKHGTDLRGNCPALSGGRHDRFPVYLEWGRLCLPQHLNLSSIGQADRGFTRSRLCTDEDGTTNNLVFYMVRNDTSKRGGTLRGLRIKRDKPIGALPGGDYALTRMVLQII